MWDEGPEVFQDAGKFMYCVWHHIVQEAINELYLDGVLSSYLVVETRSGHTKCQFGSKAASLRQGSASGIANSIDRTTVMRLGTKRTENSENSWFPVSLCSHPDS